MVNNVHPPLALIYLDTVSPLLDREVYKNSPRDEDTTLTTAAKALSAASNLGSDSLLYTVSRLGHV